jgi:photosystem II stability/assembly factor-like uncharacterized protein
MPPPGLATALAVLSVAVAAGVTALDGREGPSVAQETDPAVQTAELMPRVANSLILDLAESGPRRIAVGERGHILLSDDGRTWTQVADVPTRSTLTGVTAVGDKVWAVGHDGVIVHSPDGGRTWQRQRVAPFDELSDALHNGAPLLDVKFLDENRGFAVGAFALMLRTDDGGATWNEVPLSAATTRPAVEATEVESALEGTEEPEVGEEITGNEEWVFDDSDLDLGEESDPHLNAIARTGDGSLFVVAERGAAYRSLDGGLNWERLTLPYKGSMFGVIGYEGRHVLAFGMRGTVLESYDLGDTWAPVHAGTELSLMGGVGLGGGGAVLVGANGIVLTRSSGGTGFLAHNHSDESVLSSVLLLVPGSEVIVAGEKGLGTYVPN